MESRYCIKDEGDYRMVELINRLLPIVVLLFIGFFTKKTKMLSDKVIEGLKVIIIKIALPVVLFTSFATMDLQLSYLILFVLVFIYCIVLYGIGNLVHKLLAHRFKRVFTAGYFTGFEFGMIGVGLFSAIWGIEQLPIIMLIGLGHEIFIWFVYVPLISNKSEHVFSLLQTLKAFIKTPTIIGLILGLMVNILNLYETIASTVIGASIYTSIDMLMPLTSPLILIVVGYSMTFNCLDIKETLTYIIARLIFVLSIGSLLIFIIFKLIPDINPLLFQAFYAFILLPAPYILPLYIKDTEEASFFTQLLVYGTVVTFVGYGILLWLSI